MSAITTSIPGMHRSSNFTPGRIVAWLALAVMIIVTLMPLWMVIKTALISSGTLYDQATQVLPSDPTLVNFKRVLGLLSTQESQAAGGSGANINFTRALLNSVLFTGITVSGAAADALDIPGDPSVGVVLFDAGADA